MTLVFPSLESLHLAISTGMIPAEIISNPVEVAEDPSGSIALTFAGKLPKKVLRDLDVIQVKAENEAPSPGKAFLSWLQVIPTRPLREPPKLTSQTPIIFEVQGRELFPDLVREMLRLGNDRQSVCELTDRSGQTSLLLRVIAPPYYTLLRALDRLDQPPGVLRAYIEQAPRVWVELGQEHPFAQQIHVPQDQLLCIRTTGEWSVLADVSFRDIYDHLQFQLPAAATTWQDKPLEAKVEVPLRLVTGNTADRPELWVFQADGVEQLDRMVREADERLLEQLSFAVALQPDGRHNVLVRTRVAKKAPPTLEVPQALGYKPYWKLPNLYVPVGLRLHPVVRRDVVRNLLAPDPDSMTWLSPTESGSFQPLSLAENAFRPLTDWVDYVIDTHAEILLQWIEAFRFDFEPFICTESGSKKPKTATEKKAVPSQPRGSQPPTKTPAEIAPAPSPAESASPATGGMPQIEIRPPSEWKIRRAELQDQFLAIEGGIDAPERQALWPRLAEANAGSGDDADRSEAAICWLNTLWGYEELPQNSLNAWLASELQTQPLSESDFYRLMTPADPTPEQARGFAVALLVLCTSASKPAWFAKALPRAQQYLDRHADTLPVRAVWLASLWLSRVTGMDVLGLARTRDRLLQRLFEHGLSPERDLPRFLRNAGRADSERLHVFQERARDIHRVARHWAERGLKPSGSGAHTSDTHRTLIYLDLMFAYGLARLGETIPATALLDSTREAVLSPKISDDKILVTKFLYRAFEFRIQQAIAGEPTSGPLDPALENDLAKLQAQFASGPANNPQGIGYYAISRLLEQSQILNPHERLDPYARYTQGADELKKVVFRLAHERDASVITRTIRELYKTGIKGRAISEVRLQLLVDTLLLATRVGEAFAVELMQSIPDLLRDPRWNQPAANAADDVIRNPGVMLSRAIFLAAHFDRTDLVQLLIDEFIRFVEGRSEEHRYKLVSVVAGQSLRSMRKLGLRDEIDRFLRRLQDGVLKGQSLTDLRARHADKPDIWLDVMQTLLSLAGGWLSFGLIDQASPILDTVREEIYKPTTKLTPLKFVALIQSYIAALGHSPAEFGLPRIIEIFQQLEPNRVPNTFTSAPYYSRLHLNIAEEVVLALVSDEFALGLAGRRWLDEDEFVVRRRIHTDLRGSMTRSGL